MYIKAYIKSALTKLNEKLFDSKSNNKEKG